MQSTKQHVEVKPKMDVSPISFIDLIRNISLAIFAISTWYITREERRTRILLNLSLDAKGRLFSNLIETLVELRDQKEIEKALKGKIKQPDLKKVEKKISKLKKLDYTRTLSILTFSFMVTIEVLIFVYYLLF